MICGHYGDLRSKRLNLHVPPVNC